LDWERILPVHRVADHFGAPGLPYSVSFNWVSINARFSIDDDDLLQPLGELHRTGGLERQVMPT